MAMKMDRRTFLKTTAAAAAAVSVSGLLAGCSSGAEPLAVVKLPGFDVALTGVKIVGGNVYDENNNESLTVNAAFTMTYTGSGFAGDSVGNIFGASIQDVTLDLRTGGWIAAAEFPMGKSVSRTVTFNKEAPGVNAAYVNGEPLKLTVKLLNTTAEFSYDYNKHVETRIVPVEEET